MHALQLEPIGWGRLSSDRLHTHYSNGKTRPSKVEPNFGKLLARSDLWVATTVLKHRRRRLRNTGEHRIRGGSSLSSISIGRTSRIRHARRTEDVHVLLGPQILRCTFATPVNSQFLWIDDRIIPRRASFFCHVAIPCFHLKNTNAHRQSGMFSAPVPFEHGEHHRKKL